MRLNIPLSLKELPGKWAHLCLEVKKFITEEIGVEIQGKSLLVGASGGADSTALLCIFSALRGSLGFRLGAAYLDHRLRKDTLAEKKLVQHLCHQGKIEFFSGASSIKIYASQKGIGIEEAARIIRYKFLEGIRKKKGFDYILIAHHLNDLAEDVLLRLIRGTGWPSLGGMKGFYEEKYILRPLLMFPKQRLISFLTHIQIPWCEDTSNNSLIYRRNRIRHEILPLILRENPAFLEGISRLWKMARVEEKEMQERLLALRKKEKTTSRGTLLPAEILVLLPSSQRLRWYKDLLQRMGPGQAIFDNILNLDRCFIKKRFNKKIQFPGKKEAIISSRGIEFVIRG